jgi:hypothetical protein
VTTLINTGAVWTVDMGRPDEQLCNQNSEIFDEKSFLFESRVRTVARALQVTSLLRLCASEPWKMAVRQLIFYMQFPYLLNAGPDHGRLTSGRLRLNYELALRSSAFGWESTSSGRLQQSSHI